MHLWGREEKELIRAERGPMTANLSQGFITFLCEEFISADLDSNGVLDRSRCHTYAWGCVHSCKGFSIFTL